MRTRFFAGAAAVGIAMLAAGPATADHSWANYHWPLTGTDQSFDVYVKLDQAHWAPLVDAAVADWDGSDPDASGYTDYLKPRIVGEATHTNARKCNPRSGAVVVCATSYGQRGWLGIASVWASGDHITQATTKLNDSYHDNAPYNSTTWRQLVACQEIGHDFGLGHQNENFNTDVTQSCMEYTSAPSGNETPDDHDYEQLQVIYDNHAAESPGGGGGGGGNDRPCRGGPKKCGADPMQFREVGGKGAQNALTHPVWGTAIGFDNEGRATRFIKNLGGKDRKITHVTWVPGFKPAGLIDHKHDHHDHNDH